MQAADWFSRRDGAEAIVELKPIAKADVAVWFYSKREPFTYSDFRSKVSGYLQSQFAAEFRRSITEKTTEAMARKARWPRLRRLVLRYDTCRSSAPTACVRTSIGASRNGGLHGAPGVRAVCARNGQDGDRERLNAERQPAPRPRSRARRSIGWTAASVREVLRRSLYAGVITYRRTKKHDADGERRQQARPDSLWIRVPAPHLRIIDHELRQAAQTRLDAARTAYLRATQGHRWARPVSTAPAKYLLTGLLVCGACGGSLEVRSRVHGPQHRRGRRVHFYMCSTRRRRGASVCKGLATPMPRVDDAVLTVLETHLLDPGILAEACQRVLVEDRSVGDLHDRRAPASKADLEAQLGRLTDALAAGGDSRALLGAIRIRETALAGVERELAQNRRLRPVVNAARVRRQLDAVLRDWRATPRRHPSEAREMIWKVLKDRLVLTPGSRDERPGFRVQGSGRVDPVLNVVCTRGNFPDGI